MNKIKIVRFFSGVLIVAFLGGVYATVKVVFFDCKYGQCIVSECIEIDQKCEADNYDPKTGQELRNCCSDYKTHNIPFRNYLMKQIRFYSLICGSGLGIALGAFLADRSRKTRPSTSSRIYYHQCDTCKISFDTDQEEQACSRCKQPSKNIGLVINDPMPITFWEKFRDKLKRYLP